MLIVQITDTHIVIPNKKAYGIADTGKNLTSCVKYINSLKPKADVVLVTGDITSNKNFDALLHAKKILDDLVAPYFIIPGNHDSREDIGTLFKHKACPTTYKGFINYVIEDYEIRLIAVDSTTPNNSGGEICPERAKWLDKQLSQQPDKPTIIFMHHPPVKCSVLETDRDGFIGADLLSDVIDKYSNIKAILCGHIHLQAHVLWHNTVISIAPSIQMRLKLDLTMQEQSQFYLEHPAFQIHYWTPSKNLISYPVIVREDDKPYLFKHIDLQ